MSRDYSLYENMNMLDQTFPIIFHRDFLSKKGNNSLFKKHWHEKIEFLYIIRGEGIFLCNSASIPAKPSDLIVINSNELHEGQCLSDELEYYCIIVDTSLFLSRYADVCEAKYIKPIMQNRILFKNKIEKDEAVGKCINDFVKEYESKEIGFEMAVKASIYQLFVLLLRKHVELILTPREYNSRMRNLQRFNTILQYIENNYNEKITLGKLCSMASLSKFHFCRLFKEVTGKSVSEYLNLVRVSKAESMLRDTDLNVSEVALSCGFNDINYFSRLFRKYKNVSPSVIIKEQSRCRGGL